MQSEATLEQEELQQGPAISRRQLRSRSARRRHAEALLGNEQTEEAEVGSAKASVEELLQKAQPRIPSARRKAMQKPLDADIEDAVVESEEKIQKPVREVANPRPAELAGKEMPQEQEPEKRGKPSFDVRFRERRRKKLMSRRVWISLKDWTRFALCAVIVLVAGQLLNVAAAHNAFASTRIKDIVAFEGVRDNLLIGYGLVVGLDGTGDKLKNSAFTEQSLVAFLERLGVNTRGTELKTKNVAAVTVTATLPPFSRQGSRIDVSISAMGDAKSLQGGTLLATPLYAADGQVYAVAQGAVAIGGFSAGGEASTVTKGVPTSAAIANGGIVEREIEFDLNGMRTIDLALRNPDVTTATRVAATINQRMGGELARVRDPATVRLGVPASYSDNVTMLLAQVEQLLVETDQVARVVIDEATGTIVMGENVRVDTVAVAQGNLVVKVEETPFVSQPGAFAPPGAQTVTVPRTGLTVDEDEESQMAVLHRGATLNELVAGLNALGVGPRDLITILQTIKAAGALQAEIETR